MASRVFLRKATCHCGAVELALDMPDGLQNIRRCNCSLCRRKGALMASVPLNALLVIRGEDNLSLYQWNTGVAKHYFCKTCGIYTHHQRRSNPNEYGVNVACIEGVDPYAFEYVPVGDGAANSLVGDQEGHSGDS